MKKNLILIVVLFATAIVSCRKSTWIAHEVFTFKNGTEGWIAGFADLPDGPDVEDEYELKFEHTGLPHPLNSDKKSLMLSGNNHSDDLFMFLKRKVDGLKPGTQYHVRIEVELATNAPTQGIGVGGSPGENVFVKAGASTIEPDVVLEASSNHLRMNIDKGNQGFGGENMVIIGDLANGKDKEEYTLKTMKMSQPIRIMSNEHGELWIIVGTDSGFEGTSTVYYSKIKVWID